MEARPEVNPGATDRSSSRSRFHLIALLSLALSSCVSARATAVNKGAFYVEVIGNTALISISRSPEAIDQCVLGSGNDNVLRKLRKAGEDTKVILTFERLARPAFSDEGDSLPGDRLATVRGQVISPACDSQEFYWIRSLKIASHRTVGTS